MRVIAPFALKPEVEIAANETGGRTCDIPGARSLLSIDNFQIYRTTGLLSSSSPAPYEYVEGIGSEPIFPPVEPLARNFRDELPLIRGEENR